MAPYLLLAGHLGFVSSLRSVVIIHRQFEQITDPGRQGLDSVVGGREPPFDRRGLVDDRLW